MTISLNAEIFYGQKVVDFESDEDWGGPKICHRIRTDYDGGESAFQERLTLLASHKGAEKLTALVIGMWGTECDSSSAPVVEKLIGLTDKFAGLEAIFLGDITYEENEISWIQQSDVSPLLKAYPKLKEFRVRGGNQLEFSIVIHPNLESLAIEAGGLPRAVVRQITRCDFPNLKTLELWLGTDNYGWDGGPEDLQPILAGRFFPKLESLGICNVDGIDEYVPVIVNSPIVQKLKNLDLSKGNLTDVGAKSLLDLAPYTQLETLDLSHHYLSEAMQKELKKKLKCKINFDDPQNAEDEWRSIYVSE